MLSNVMFNNVMTIQSFFILKMGGASISFGSGFKIFKKYEYDGVIAWLNGTQIHLKLRDIHPCNVTHSLTCQHPRERMFLVQISLLIVTFLSLMSRVLPLVQTIIEVNPHPHIVPCVNMWSVFFFFSCHLLNC